MEEIELSEEKIKEQQVRRDIRDYIARRFGGRPLIQPYNGKTIMVVDGTVMDDNIKSRAKKL